MSTSLEQIWTRPRVSAVGRKRRRPLHLKRKPQCPLLEQAKCRSRPKAELRGRKSRHWPGRNSGVRRPRNRSPNPGEDAGERGGRVRPRGPGVGKATLVRGVRRAGVGNAARHFDRRVISREQFARGHKRGGWGTEEAHALIEADGCWSNPKFAYATPN